MSRVSAVILALWCLFAGGSFAGGQPLESGRYEGFTFSFERVDADTIRGKATGLALEIDPYGEVVGEVTFSSVLGELLPSVSGQAHSHRRRAFLQLSEVADFGLETPHPLFFGRDGRSFFYGRSGAEVDASVDGQGGGLAVVYKPHLQPIPSDIEGSWWGVSFRAGMATLGDEIISFEMENYTADFNGDGTVQRQMLETSGSGEVVTGTFSWSVSAGGFVAVGDGPVFRLNEAKDLLASAAVHGAGQDDGGLEGGDGTLDSGSTLDSGGSLDVSLETDLTGPVLAFDLLVKTATVAVAEDLVGVYGGSLLSASAGPEMPLHLDRVERFYLRLRPNRELIVTSLGERHAGERVNTYGTWETTSDGKVRLVMAGETVEVTPSASGNLLLGYFSSADESGALVENEFLMATRLSEEGGDAVDFFSDLEAVTPYGAARSQWAGEFSDLAYFPWVWHDEHGSWYCYGSGGPVIFIYDYVLGWLYTQPDFYPYVYAYSDARPFSLHPDVYTDLKVELDDQPSWLYYYKGSGTYGDNRWFYDFSIARWVIIDDYLY